MSTVAKDFENKLNEHNTISYVRRDIAGTAVFTVSIPAKNVPAIIVDLYLDDIDENKVRFNSNIISNVHILRRTAVVETLNVINAKSSFLFVLEDNRITASGEYHTISEDDVCCEIHQIMCGFAAEIDIFMPEILYALWNESVIQGKGKEKVCMDEERSIKTEMKKVRDEETANEFMDELLNQAIAYTFGNSDEAITRANKSRLIGILDKLAMERSPNEHLQKLFVKGMLILALTLDGQIYRYHIVRSMSLENVPSALIELMKVLSQMDWTCRYAIEPLNRTRAGSHDRNFGKH